MHISKDGGLMRYYRNKLPQNSYKDKANAGVLQ